MQHHLLAISKDSFCEGSLNTEGLPQKSALPNPSRRTSFPKGLALAAVSYAAASKSTQVTGLTPEKAVFASSHQPQEETLSKKVTATQTLLTLCSQKERTSWSCVQFSSSGSAVTQQWHFHAFRTPGCCSMDHQHLQQQHCIIIQLQRTQKAVNPVCLHPVEATPLYISICYLFSGIDLAFLPSTDSFWCEVLQNCSIKCENKGEIWQASVIHVIIYCL